MKELSTRQSVFLLVLAMMSTKIQRLPALLAQLFGRNGWLFLLFMATIDIAFLLILLLISKLTKGKTIHHVLKVKCGNVVAKGYSIVFGIFFLMKILTPFRGTHEFFVSAIFDDLDWLWFSLLFVLLIMFMSACGLNRLGRASEIIGVFSILGFVLALFLALPTANFERILPIEMFSAKKFANGALKLSPWVTDFAVVLFFVGRVKENKFKTAMFSSFAITAAVLTFFCLTFYAIYDNLATFPNVAISSITEFTLLSQSLGRIDWIVVLFIISSSVLSAGFFALVACESFCEATTIPKKWIALFIGVVVYVLDLFVFVNVDVFVNFYFSYYSWFVVAINYLLPIAILIIIFATKNKKPKYFLFPYKFRPKSLQELKIKQLNSLHKKTKTKAKTKKEVTQQ